MVKCTCCGKEVEGVNIIFKCPQCEKNKIVRCVRCRKLSIKYKCSCGFGGP